MVNADGLLDHDEPAAVKFKRLVEVTLLAQHVADRAQRDSDGSMVGAELRIRTASAAS